MIVFLCVYGYLSMFLNGVGVFFLNNVLPEKDTYLNNISI